MSESADDREKGAREGLQALDSAVSGLLERLASAVERAGEAEARRDEVEELLREMTEGTADPAEMSGRLTRLEEENADLRRRVDEAADGIDRLLSQIRFLEDQR